MGCKVDASNRRLEVLGFEFTCPPVVVARDVGLKRHGCFEGDWKAGSSTQVFPQVL